MNLTAADLLLARQVGVNYRAMADSLRREAFLERMQQHVLTARIIENYAAIATRAALREERANGPERYE